MKIVKISVLVPIFNVEKYLEECLDSVVNQTLKDIEIICIDDGSTDNSPTIIKRYADKDPRIKTITKKNSGYGDSMNKGLAKASGEYVAIVESDDFIDSTMLEKLYKLGKKNDAEVVKSNYYNYFTHLNESSPQWNDEMNAVYSVDQGRVIQKHNTKYNIVSGNKLHTIVNPRKEQHIMYQKPAIWSAIYKNSFLRDNKIKFLATPGASYQDTGFSFKVWASAKRAVFTDQAFLHYRQDNEASSVHNPGKVFCVADEYAEIENFLKKNSLYDELGPLMQKTKYGAYLWNFNRLAAGLDKSFLEKFSNEFKNAHKSGVLDFFFFDKNERRMLNEIIESPDQYILRKRAKENAKISVIVPVYNTEDYLKECLESLQNQSFQDIEVICIDDGSSDKSTEILETFEKNDPRFIVKSRNNHGPASSRNHGMSLASGDYIMFCDSDDTYNKEMCKKMYAAIADNDADMAVCGINVIYTSDTTRSYRISDDEYYRLKFTGIKNADDSVIKRTDVSPCNKIFKVSKQRGLEIWFPSGMWYEDAKFFNDYAVACKNIFFLKNKDKLYNYTRRDSGIMSSTVRKTPRALDHVRILNESFKFMKLNGFFTERKDLFVYNFKQYYALSKKYLPEDKLDLLYEFTSSFLSKNKRYIDSVDPSIAQEIRALLPKSTIYTKGRKQLKKTIKNPVHKTWLTLSPTYRRQELIINSLEQLKDRMMTVEQMNNKVTGRSKK